jgi:hypothetical protein
MNGFTRSLCVLAAALPLWAAEASAFEVGGELAARAWFFSANGRVQSTDLDALGFDSLKGQPEFRGSLALGRRFHVGASYLRIRRSERGTISGTILGILQFDNDVSLDVEVDDIRGHFGYSVLASDWIDVEPFVEVSYLREDTTLVNHTLGQTSRQKDDIVFPLPGLGVVAAPNSPLHVQVRAEGMGIDRGHLIDVSGGIEGVYRFAFLGAGYRFVDFELKDSGDVEQADAQLKGLYVEGGWRF